MPELPEVEIMAQNLSRWAAGRVLTRVDLRDPRLDMAGLAALAKGRCDVAVGRVWRRGKYAVMDLMGADGVQQSLVLHFRMTGKVVVARPGERRGERLVLTFQPAPGRPESVVFVDARRLGTAWLLPGGELEAWFSESRRLGPEPWPMHRRGAFWKERLKGTRSPIKVALMMQHRVAGLGNIAASESLWRAGVHPDVPASQLTDVQWERVAEGVRGFIAHTLEQESGDEIAYVNSRGGSRRGVASPFSVYRNDGGACSRCGAAVRRGKHSGRSTFWCPVCQEAP